jgi:hypothetical protein
VVKRELLSEIISLLFELNPMSHAAPATIAAAYETAIRGKMEAIGESWHLHGGNGLLRATTPFEQMFSPNFRVNSHRGRRRKLDKGIGNRIKKGRRPPTISESSSFARQQISICSHH